MAQHSCVNGATCEPWPECQHLLWAVCEDCQAELWAAATVENLHPPPSSGKGLTHSSSSSTSPNTQTRWVLTTCLEVQCCGQGEASGARVPEFQSQFCMLWGKLFGICVLCFLSYNMELILAPTL